MEEDQESVKIEANASSLAEPAFFLAAISGLFYIFSYRYYEGFCQRLSLPFSGLDIPFTFYLAIGFKIVVFILSILYLLAFLLFIKKIKDIFKFLVFSGIFIIIFILASLILKHFILLDITLEYAFKNWIFLTFVLLISILVKAKDRIIFDFWKLIIGIFINEKEIDLINLCSSISYDKKRITKIVKLLTYILIATPLLIFVFYIYPFGLGDNDAKELIEGQFGSLEITFNPIDKDDNISNKSLILIMQLNNNFYVVEKKNPSPIQATSYIIPDREIKNATIKTSERCIILHRTTSYIYEKWERGFKNWTDLANEYIVCTRCKFLMS